MNLFDSFQTSTIGNIFSFEFLRESLLFQSSNFIIELSFESNRITTKNVMIPKEKKNPLHYAQSIINSKFFHPSLINRSIIQCQQLQEAFFDTFYNFFHTQISFCIASSWSWCLKKAKLFLFASLSMFVCPFDLKLPL